MEWHTVMTPNRRLTPFGIISFLSCAAFVTLSGLPADAGQKPAPSQDPFVRMNESIDALTKKVWPSVVQVLVSSYGPREDSSADPQGIVGLSVCVAMDPRPDHLLWRANPGLGLFQRH